MFTISGLNISRSDGVGPIHNGNYRKAPWNGQVIRTGSRE